LLPLFACSLVVSSLAAQGTQIVPASLANTFGNSNNNIPFSWNPTRYQQVFLGSEMANVVIMRGLGMRQDDGFSGYAGHTVDLEMKLGGSTLDHTTLGITFDSNFDVTSPPPVKVFPRAQTKLPNMPPQRPTNPQEFFIKLPFAAPYTWIKVPGRNLVIEVVNWGNSNSNQIFTYPLDAGSGITTTRLYASGAPTATTGTLGVGYGHVMAFLDRVAVTGDYQLFGTGCKGTGGGNGIPALSNTGRPVINTTFSVDLAQAATGTVAVLVLGASNTMFGTIPLPLDLTAAGAPGCNLLCSVDLTGGVPTSSTGTASIPIVVPNAVILVGIRLYNQWIVVDKAANQLGVALSNGGNALIGDQ
jgi:hypothetical protein